MNKSEKNLTKKQLLKVLPEVREISIGIGIADGTLNNVTLSKAHFKRIIAVADSDQVLNKIELLTLENGIFIIVRG